MEESTEGGSRVTKEKGLDNLIGLTGDLTEGLEEGMQHVFGIFINFRGELL